MVSKMGQKCSQCLLCCLERMKSGFFLSVDLNIFLSAYIVMNFAQVYSLSSLACLSCGRTCVELVVRLGVLLQWEEKDFLVFMGSQLYSHIWIVPKIDLSVFQ